MVMWTACHWATHWTLSAPKKLCLSLSFSVEQLRVRMCTSPLLKDPRLRVEERV